MEAKQRIRLSCAAALALAAGCTTDAGESMIIVQNQVPTDGCVVPSGDSANFLGRGRIDAQATEGYIFTPLVESLVAADASKQSARIVAVRGADVDIEFPDGFLSASDEAGLRDDRLTRFSTAFSGSIRTGGKTSFAFVILPQGLLTRVGGLLGTGEEVEATAKISVFGDLDGEDVESVPFVYPIAVCQGCMKVDNGDCESLGDSFEPSQGGVCNQLQDKQVDCCTTGGAEVCPVPT
jgi:hypothetical protein